MQPDLVALGAGFARFWSERHFSTLSTVRPDGSVHAVPVGVTLDIPAAIARVICSGASQKARLAADAGSQGSRVALCQVDGHRWSTLEGRAVMRSASEMVADAEERYAVRYRKPRANPNRVLLEITVTGVLGNV